MSVHLLLLLLLLSPHKVYIEGDASPAQALLQHLLHHPAALAAAAAHQ